MFRLITIMTFAILVATPAFADGYGWGYQPQQRYYAPQPSYGYAPNRIYMPPPVIGYYQAPREYYGLPPVRGFVYQQPMRVPRCDHNFRRGW